jgi:sarcosine oxidase subunit beta
VKQGERLESAPKTADIVIVGGGIAGAASAFWLSRAGFRPLLIEREEDLAMATTSASAHCIRAQFSEPENIAQMCESLAIYTNFAEVLGLPDSQADIDLHQQGYLFASTEPDDAEAFAARVARQRTLGLDDVELLDGDEIRRRYAWISPMVAVGAYRHGDGWIDGCRATRLFAAASDADLLLNTEVSALECPNGTVTGVVTSKGTIATDRVVLAAGPFSAILSPTPLPLTLLRRNRVIISPDERIPQYGPLLIDANTGAHWRPHQDGALIAWAQPEKGGPPTWPVTPDPAFPDLVLKDPGGVSRLSPFWHDIVPTLDPGSIHLTAGQYTVTPDHKPVIGPAPSVEGLWLNTGYSGHGIMGSASGGRLLADIVSGKCIDPDQPFAPDRFARETKAPDVEQIVL